LALLTTLVVLSSFFVIAGAQVASAAQCGRGQAACHLNFFTQPHRAGRFQAITNQDLIDPSQGGQPVVVEVLDGDGIRDITYAGQIRVSVSYANPAPGGTLFGTTTVNAVNGAASFSDLSLDVAADYRLTAVALTGTGIAPATSVTFRIEYSACDAGQTCAAPFQDLSEVSMAYTGSGRGAVSHGTDELSNCTVPGVFTDPFFHGPAEWSAIAVLPVVTTQATRPGSTNQLIEHRIFKRWRQIVLDHGSSSYRECVTSPVAFVPWPGSPLTCRSADNCLGPAPRKYTGLLADCSKTNTGLCQAYVKSTKAGDILEGISAPPSALVPDPRGH
jgi:hypothetical protein